MIREHVNKLRNDAGVRRYTKNISWMFFARMFTLGISFITTLYVARTLGPTNFGELDYALAVIGLFSPLATFGIINVLNRELIKHPDKKNELTGTAFILNSGFSLLALLCVVTFALLSPINSVSRFLIIILSTTYLFGVFQILQQDFYARAESKIPSIITVLVWTIISISKVCVLVLGKGIIWLALITVLEQVLYAIAIFFAYHYYTENSIVKWKFSSFYFTNFKTGGAIVLVTF
jgi:O-antigen/teichoic acid export membrane protein